MTASPTAAPLRLRTIADAANPAPKDWVVHGLLAAGEVSGLIAPPSTGKSALAVDLAASVATGETWFGRAVTRGAALYVAAERGGVTLRRLKAFATYQEASAVDVAVISERIDLLRSDRDAKRILDAVQSYEQRTGEPVRLITIDTARAVMPGGDENSPRDMGELARHLGIIRDGAPAAHLQVLHHTPKSRPRELSGHTSLSAMLDAVMVVAPEKSERKSWQVIEANDLAALPPKALFELQPVVIGKDSAGEPLTAPVVQPIEQNAPQVAAKPAVLPTDAATALDVLQALQRGGEPITCDRWSEAIRGALGPGKGGKERSDGAKRQAASAARKLLLETGFIRQSGDIVSVSSASG